MNFETFWWKVWVIRDSEGDGGPLLPKNNEFWLEPVQVNGTAAYFCLRSEPKKMHPCFQNKSFYPLGFSQIPVDPLPPWKDDPTILQIYRDAARKVRQTGLQNPTVARLEATIQVDGGEDTARIYAFPGAQQDGRDWMVFDLIAGPSSQPVPEQDGTANGDPK
jgi:hypothetical protein